MEDENFFEKCKTCQHCYTKNDDDYVYCRKRNGKCEYKPYKSRKATNCSYVFTDPKGELTEELAITANGGGEE